MLWIFGYFKEIGMFKEIKNNVVDMDFGKNLFVLMKKKNIKLIFFNICLKKK